jgi:hypothetical protein
MMFLLGATEASRLQAMRHSGNPPSLHAPTFYPDFEPVLVTGVGAMGEALIDLLQPTR